MLVGTAISDQVANVVVAQLRFLDRENPDKEIQLSINLPGAVIYPGPAIYDAMQMMRAPISTIVVGWTTTLATRCGQRVGRDGGLLLRAPPSTCVLPAAARGAARPTSRSSAM